MKYKNIAIPSCEINSGLNLRVQQRRWFALRIEDLQDNPLSTELFETGLCAADAESLLELAVRAWVPASLISRVYQEVTILIAGEKVELTYPATRKLAAKYGIPYGSWNEPLLAQFKSQLLEHPNYLKGAPKSLLDRVRELERQNINLRYNIHCRAFTDYFTRLTGLLIALWEENKRLPRREFALACKNTRVSGELFWLKDHQEKGLSLPDPQELLNGNLRRHHRIWKRETFND